MAFKKQNKKKLYLLRIMIKIEKEELDEDHFMIYVCCWLPIGMINILKKKKMKISLMEQQYL